ncbi:MAG: M28 family peptidase [Acidobacteria bacterium]|nr:M28 family peptidase [Acidobacteriota bacterium]
MIRIVIKILWLLAVLFLLACASGELVANKESASPTTVKKSDNKMTTDFDGARAFAHVKAQVDLGPRPAGTAALEKTRQYILRELNSYGLKTTLDQFTPLTPKGKLKMANIIAELPGESPEIIIIASHYDTKLFTDFTFLGANDAGSSTGALLEIARVMAAARPEKTRFTYQFVFFDGEEAICREWSQCLNGKDNTYGSRYMVERLKSTKQLHLYQAMILLDMVGDKNLEILKEDESSSWLVEAIWGTARRLGFTKQFPNRSHSITDDHIHFLEAGIPAIDLIDFDYGDDQRDFWHTKEDTLDKLSPQSLKIVGDVVILSLPDIELQIR